MITSLMILMLVICLSATIYFCVVTMIRCRSEKKHFYVLGLFALILYIIGYISELASPDADAMFTGIMLMYCGSSLITPLFLLFVIDYCEIEVKKRFIIPAILVFPVITLLFVWTSRYHTLYFELYTHNEEAHYLGLQMRYGTAYYITQLYTMVYIAAACVLPALRLVRWDKSRRSALLLVMLAAATPLLTQSLYALIEAIIGLRNGRVLIEPYTLVIVYGLLYAYIIRYDIFDFAPRAYSLSFDLLSDTVVLVDADMKYNGSNSAAAKIFADIAHLKKGSPVQRLGDWPAELTGLGTAVKLNEITFEFAGTPERSFVARVGKIVSRDIVLGFCIVIREMTELNLAMKKLRVAAYTDSLTGLYNRRHFFELAAAETARADRANAYCGIMMIDIDYFKKCNDKYGHAAGDEVLRVFASSIKNTVRQYDILARYGGEEFIVLVPDTGSDECLQLAERIRACIQSTPCIVDDITISITCSIGVTLRVKNESVDAAIERADKALYAAKERGRNRCVYSVHPALTGNAESPARS